MKLEKQTDHTDEAGYGKYGNGEGGLFEDCEAGVGEVVEKC